MSDGCGTKFPKVTPCDAPPGPCSPQTFTRVRGMDVRRTLASKLTPTADRIRDLYTSFGLRPYIVQQVRVRWSEGHRGRGTPEVIRLREILPTPLVVDMATMTELTGPVGVDELGVVAVTQISGRFTEEQLRGFDDAGKPTSKDEEFFYELEFPERSGQPGMIRRFTLDAAPMFRADQFQWKLRLARAHGDRARNGDVVA